MVVMCRMGCLERSRTRREWSASRKADGEALSTTGHWMASSKGRNLRSIAGLRWPCWLGLVMVPWLIWALAARTFESLHDIKLLHVGSGRRKHRKAIRRCSGWNETSWKWSSREAWTTADACWATEDGPIVSTRTVRVVRRAAVRRTLEWRRRKSTTRCDEH